jgi:hypothetical protein
MHIFAAVALLTFLLLPPAHAVALWSGGLFVYYSVTAFGQPEHTGRREWPAMQAWLGQQLERFLPAWLGERLGHRQGLRAWRGMDLGNLVRFRLCAQPGSA